MFYLWGLEQLLDAFSCSAFASSLICLNHSSLILSFILFSFLSPNHRSFPLSSPFPSSHAISWFYVLYPILSQCPVILCHLIFTLQVFCSAYAFHSLAHPSSSLRPVIACHLSSPPHRGLPIYTFLQIFHPVSPSAHLLPDLIYSVPVLFYLCDAVILFYPLLVFHFLYCFLSLIHLLCHFPLIP